VARCEASQKGLVCERPQRQSAIGPSGSAKGRPSASTTRTGPVTFSGPSSRTLISTGVLSIAEDPTHEEAVPMRFKLPSPAMIVALLALVMATSGTAVAAVSFARNAGAVDGKSAVGNGASNRRAAGKLVATTRRGPNRGKLNPKYLSGVVRGGSSTFGRAFDVADNQSLAPVLIGGVFGLGTLTATCNDQSPRPGFEDPSTTITFANLSGEAISISKRVGNGAAVVAPLPNGVQTTVVVTGSNTFELQVQRRGTNYAVNGVVRQDGSRTPAAQCLVYGYALTIPSS
jgi:hypothetical protein